LKKLGEYSLKDAFEDFVQGLNFPHADDDEAIPASGDDMVQLSEELQNRINALIDDTLDDMSGKTPDEYHDQLNAIALMIIQRLLQRTTVSQEAIEELSREELIQAAIVTYVALAIIAYDRIAVEFSGPDEDEDGSE
jgi:hypothetical protein